MKYNGVQGRRYVSSENSTKFWMLYRLITYITNFKLVDFASHRPTFNLSSDIYYCFLKIDLFVM